jgi:hypothetical protein
MAMLPLFLTIRVVYSLQRAKYTEIRAEKVVVGVFDHHLLSLFSMFFICLLCQVRRGV